MSGLRSGALLALVAFSHAASGQDTQLPARYSASFTVSYYAMRDEPDFGVGVASINRGPLRLEARYNYEAKQATSVFVGWKFSGGDTLTYEVTPIAGALFGAAHAAIPGVEASVAYGALDAYVEAEYVVDRDTSAGNYFYAWSELGWRPVEWLRIGLVGQRTRIVHNDRDLQRGVFGQLALGGFTVGLYAFNPDAGSRYAILSIGASF
jgi:hypothetical protein